MIDVTSLSSLLQNAITHEEEIFDIRFEEVVSLVDQEKWDDALSLIKQIFQEGTIDIRLVMYQFYAQFVTQGVSSLKEITPTIISLIDEFWEKISPVNMRDKYLISSLTWLLSSITKKLKRTEKLFKDKKTDEFWDKSVITFNLQENNKLLSVIQTFSKFIALKIGEPSINQSIQFITQWIENTKNFAKEEVILEEVANSSEQPLPLSEEKPKIAASLPEVSAPSDPMDHLLRKLRAFETLIESRNFDKAALISDDITNVIKNFDPTVFFPKLFTRYFSLSAAHMDSLSESWEARGSLKWEALHRLYQTDLDEFIKW